MSRLPVEKGADLIFFNCDPSFGVKMPFLHCMAAVHNTLQNQLAYQGDTLQVMEGWAAAT
jgi:hypothetical protein